MEQGRVQPLTSSPYQYVVGYASSQDLSRCDSHEPITSKSGDGSYDERVYAHHYAHEPLTTRSLSAPIDAFDPWILEAPPCGSPLSTSSSISHTESVPTPPYTGMPVYDQVNSPAFQHVRSPTSHDAWSGELEPVWRPSYPEITTWGSQPFSLSYHGGRTCDQTPLQPVQDYIPQAGPPVAQPYIPFSAPIRYSPTRVVDSAPFKQEVISNPDDSDKDSESEAVNSESDDDDSSHSTSRNSGANASVMKLGKGGNAVCSFSTTLQHRHYRCPLEDKKYPGRPCPKGFVRPEHFRRHVRTVHSTMKPHACKVCNKVFSRSDNLRDHYSTHLKQGKRKCTNKRISFDELKAILGPEENELVQRLERKLHDHQARRRKAKEGKVMR